MVKALVLGIELSSKSPVSLRRGFESLSRQKLFVTEKNCVKKIFGRAKQGRLGEGSLPLEVLGSSVQFTALFRCEHRRKLGDPKTVGGRSAEVELPKFARTLYISRNDFVPKSTHVF